MVNPSDVITPSLLFPTVARIGATQFPDVGCWDDESILVKPIEVAGKGPGTMYYIGAGDQFIHHGAELLRNLELAVLRLESREKWSRPSFQRTLLSIFKQFFGAARRQPCALWAHALCWTDRAVIRGDCDGELRTPEDRRFEEIDWGRPIYLFYDDADHRGGVRIASLPVPWHAPDGVSSQQVGLVKIIESRETWLGDRLVTGSHREQVGVGCCAGDFTRALHKGLHPAAWEVAYELVRGDSLWELRKTSRFGSSEWQDDPVDPIGILDVEIVKLWRLFRRTFLGREVVFVDELSIACDRAAGEVVYVAATRDRTLHEEMRSFAASHLGIWLSGQI